MTTLADLRKQSLEEQGKTADAPTAGVAAVRPPAQPTEKPVSNMTGHITDNTTIKADSNTVGQNIIKQDSFQDDSPVIQKDSLQESGTAGRPSIRQAIQASVQQAGASSEPLKTVTIKLSPDLDRRVEDHCYQRKRKKQEVIRDALLLYFEVIEEAEQGG